MKAIFLYQIVDRLSESIISTFLAASFKHATSQFRKFLDSLKGKIEDSDFVLIELGSVDVCETYEESVECIFNSSYATLFGAPLPEESKLEEAQSDES